MVICLPTPDDMSLCDSGVAYFDGNVFLLLLDWISLDIMRSMFFQVLLGVVFVAGSVQ